MSDNNLAQKTEDESVDEFSSIAGPIRKEYDRACDADREKVPLNPPEDLPVDFSVDDYENPQGKFSTGDYKVFVEHHMGNNLLSGDDLKIRISILRELYMRGKFKRIFRGGTKFWLIPVPIDGNGFSNRDISTHKIKELNYCSVEANGLTHELFPKSGYFYPAYPGKLRACAFNIPPYSDKTPYPTPTEFEKIVEDFTYAYERLMEMGF